MTVADYKDRTNPIPLLSRPEILNDQSIAALVVNVALANLK